LKVLVTGGAGFIGSWLVDAVLSMGHEVIVVDSLSEQVHGPDPAASPTFAAIAHACDFVRADVRDASIFDQILPKVDSVVHLAAETGTGQSMYRIARYYDVNQMSTARLFESIATRNRHIRNVVLASSRSIYGEGAYELNGRLFVPPPRDRARLEAGQFEPEGPNGERLTVMPTPESAPPSPASVYAATKLANEQLGQIAAAAFGVGVTSLRFQNVYGERQSLRNPYTGILSIFANRMRQGLPINIFEDGLESRDFIHVLDVIQSIMLALRRTSPGYLVANVGSGKASTVMEVARMLKRLLCADSELRVTGDFRVGDIRHCYADLSVARRALEFEPQITLARGLERFVSWVSGQPVIEDQSDVASAELTQLGLGRTSE
jgi:dTDP-L-rhamnose 4-epimerase